MVLAHNFDEVQRTEDVKTNLSLTFDTMLLSKNTLEGLKNSGFYRPSPIQLYGIPLGKCGFDLLLEAKSGTGKTAVFSIIALEKLELCKGLQVIILAPTREIAYQICDVVKQIGQNIKGLQVEVVMGGLSVEEDIKKFNKKVHIVVGSPGRLKHLIEDKHIDTSSVRLLIFDEADKLMEKSFLTEINYIYSVTPKQKQIIMSSATYSKNAKLLIHKLTQDAQHICPESNSILLGIEQKVIIVKFNNNIVKQTLNRFEELLKVLSTRQFKQCLIFCNYQVRVSELHKMLTNAKWPAEQLFGQQDQSDRLEALKTLQAYKCRILISTDLAARGIDASNVDLIINFEPPFEWQNYLHRIGRAGRFGSYGIAVSILSEGSEVQKFKKELSIMKEYLNIKTMWTNEVFNFDSEEKHINGSNTKQINGNEPVILSDVLHNKSSANPSLFNNLDTVNKENNLNTESKHDDNNISMINFWKMLINESEQYQENVESFEKLCHLYEKSSMENIESFSELLSSFNDDTVDPKESSYPNIQMISLHLQNNPVVNNMKDFAQIEISGVNKVTMCKQSKNREVVLKNRNLECLTNDCDNNQSNEMKMLDLPSSFSSKRSLKIKKNRRANLDNFKQNQVNKNEYYYSTLKSKDQYQHYDASEIKDTLGSQSSSSLTSIHGDTFKRNTESKSNLELSTKKINYINWYNQLKMRIKQIELAIYIEELSKI